MTENAEKREPRKRARRTLESGYSLLSRGEPQIWLIGGMLVVCLLMITSLLTLILYRGLPAFWPRPVDWVVLNDGSQEIGQPQYRQAGLLSDSKTATTGTDEGVTVDVLATDTEDNPDGYSSYYRTGNYRLSGVHYRWLDSTLLDDSAISSPNDAVVVERLEWGRFYGVPVQMFQEIHPSDEALEQLEKLIQIKTLLEAAAGGEVEDAEQMTAAIEAVSAAWEQLFADSIAKGIADRQAALGPRERIQVQSTEGGAWEALAQESEQTVFAARVTSDNTEQFASEMEARIERAIDIRESAKSLLVKVSRLDAEIAQMRIGVRQAEIDTKTDSVVLPDTSHYNAEQLVNLGLYLQWAGEAESSIAQLVGNTIDSDAIDVLQKAIAAAKTTALPSLAAAQEAEFEAWLAISDSQPEEIVDALKRYAEAYRETFARKLPLQRQIEQMHRQSARDSFSFCVPNGSTQVADIAQEDLGPLASGTLTTPVREALESAGVNIGEEPEVDTVELSRRLTMVRITDTDGQRLAMSLVEADYIDDDVSLQLHQLTHEVLPAEEIVRLVRVNELTLGGKLSVYFDRWREFLLDEPREANSEGGVFPAIWGTIVMTLIMTIAVVPFGVMAALYLREYAGAGPLVSLIRISINNLAGVPSIVYGVFGFSFFCYTIGAYIDGGAKNADITPWPSATWFMWLSICAVVGTGAFFASFASSGPTGNASRSKKMMGRIALVLWLTSLAVFAALILKSPFFDGFYQAQLPNPTFGKGGLLWAALTLALLTLPVVIVATEEALAAVPNSLREGSLACGASKWQTIRRIILPHARPGILTGAILAMARGAGEVAPLMLVGALPSAPDLPLDSEFPFFHGSRSFMHLGYQIYTLGFQSQNSDAAVPMVFTCTLLLIAIVAALNIFAILLRARLKKRFEGNQF